MGGALEGIKVLDLSQWQQGPYATVMLADMGADVIKVERPEYGDAGRHALGGYDPHGLAPDFFAHNRGKRSVTIDLAQTRGRELVLELAEHVDVVINNFRAGVMEKWDLGYEVFRRRNPRLIYARASGAGPKGPHAGKPMFDIVAQAMGGIMSVNGEDGSVPTPIGTFMADQTGAMMLVIAILGALLARERTGEGQSLEVSLLGTQVALQSFEISHYLMTGQLPARAGRGHPHSDLLWHTFPSADGFFTAAGVREDRWAAFCRLLGVPDLAEDERFDCRQHRLEHREELLARLDAQFAQHPTAHWVEALAALDIACGPVQAYDEVARDPQVLANGYITAMDHPSLGRVKVVSTPIDYSATPVRVGGPPPELGQHTEEVLLEIGYDWPQILELRDAGAI